jgi:hypothetical protein
MKKYVFFLLIIFSFASCNFSYLVSKNQKVALITKSENNVLINNKVPEMEDGKTLLPRDGDPHQITVARPGYKTDYKVCMPYKYGAAAICTGIGNFTLFGVLPAVVAPQTILPCLALGGGVSALTIWNKDRYYDMKFWDYDSEIIVGNDMMKYPVKDSTMKQIRLNKLSVNVSPEKTSVKIIKYGDYKDGRMTSFYKDIKKEENIIAQNSTLTSELNKVLAIGGFIDTTSKVLNNGYKSNLLLEGTIVGYTSNFVPPIVNRTKLNWVGLKAEQSPILGFLKITTETKWDVLDIYKNVIYSDTIVAESGEFVAYEESSNSKYSENAIKDAQETSLLLLMKKAKFTTEAKLPIESKSALDTIIIPISKNYVVDLEQAVASTVTIKTKDGHGSGFLISETGHIITNYHVVTDTNHLEAIFNEGERFKIKVLRVNKEADLALVKIEANTLLPFKVTDDEHYNIGNEIFAIGTPSALDLRQTISKGIISSVRKNNDGNKYIQTDASVNGGNSGGPLIDENGMLFGVVNAKLVGSGVEGIAFGIPASDITKKLNIKFK